MPANLTPQYLEAEQAFKEAKTTAEKIAALEEMLAVIPKHKGTEKLQADIKRRLSKLREEGERRAKAGRQDPFLVEKHGAGQVALVGFPNSGKSALVGALTRAKVVVADYPFSTVLPIAGMMPFEDIWIQLVDMPPVTAEEMPAGMGGALRNADAVLIVVDASSDDCLDQLEGALTLLREKRILRDATDLEAGALGHALADCMVVATKLDAPRARGNLEILQECLPPGLDIVPVSVTEGENLEVLRRRIFDLLGIIRIYTKVPGGPPDMGQPFVLKKGSTVVDMAAAVHRDFPSRLKNARIWGSARFEGQSVPRDYVLRDKDIVELHV
ncbi:MAG: 50S ribosome-binding GTPase [Firmicutes bacterium]|jgi:ribosome-interacting GTPase 1|nr:50S ribosome-binding GTPase [Bacillota bacterium]MDH7494576.1 50S ribosome-binding GTPase [Bacillota bacterium]